jgi:hypothetical protein
MLKLRWKAIQIMRREKKFRKKKVTKIIHRRVMSSNHKRFKRKLRKIPKKAIEYNGYYWYILK